MSKADSSSRPGSRPEPFFTIRISRTAGVLALLALLLIAGLIYLELRSRRPVQATAPVEEEVQPEPELSATAKPAELRTQEPEEAPLAIAARNEQPAEAPERTEVAEGPPSSSPRPVMPVLAEPTGIVVASRPHDAEPAGPVILAGAGTQFPSNIYAIWFSKFRETHPDIRIGYQSIGSTEGIRKLLAGSVDFGATDVALTDQQLSRAGGEILHVPTVLRGVVPIYHVQGRQSELRFTPEILAGIYLGQIFSWDDAAIAKENPGRHLPNEEIVVVHRSDGNASTLLFTNYLSKTNEVWRTSVGEGTSVKWPKGLGSKNEEGVANTVGQIEGAVGYIDLRYAMENSLTFGSVQNSAGRFVGANLDSLTQAAASVREMPSDFRASITDAPGRDAYPITGFTWILVPTQRKESQRRGDLLALLDWMIGDGESMTRKFNYAPLPPKLIGQVRQRIEKLR